jgi:DnaJ-class molecular chaperone
MSKRGDVLRAQAEELVRAADLADEEDDCHRCSGHGWVNGKRKPPRKMGLDVGDDVMAWLNNAEYEHVDCPVCHGSGEAKSRSAS